MWSINNLKILNIQLEIRQNNTITYIEYLLSSKKVIQNSRLKPRKQYRGVRQIMHKRVGRVAEPLTAPIIDVGKSNTETL